MQEFSIWDLKFGFYVKFDLNIETLRSLGSASRSEYQEFETNSKKLNYVSSLLLQATLRSPLREDLCVLKLQLRSKAFTSVNMRPTPRKGLLCE